MKRVALTSMVFMAALLMALFSHARHSAAEEMDTAALLAVVNETLYGSGWRAESIAFTDNRMERRQGEERLLMVEIEVTAVAQEPFYWQTERVGDIVFAEQTVAVGDRFVLYGEALLYTAPSVREKDVRLRNVDEMYMMGRTLEGVRAASRTVLLEGTEEAIAARAAIAQARAEAEAAERAETERLAAFYSGDWIGLSQCGNNDFEHRITLQPAPERDRFTGEVAYRVIHPDAPFEVGHYAATARIDRRRDQLVIEHDGWIERPQNTRTVGITLTAEGDEDGAPVTLTGGSGSLMHGTFSGNCSFRLQRPDAYSAERDAVMSPVRALLARMEPGVWIEGSQTGPERDGRTDWPVRVRVDEITENYVVAVAELRAFHQNSRRVLNDVEYPFTLFLTHGVENIRIAWGRRPLARGGDMRNLYTRSNFCSALRISLDTETGVLIGSNNDRQGCIDEIRLPFVAPSE